MAPPNTADIFFDLNEFLSQNEGPYKEIHKELEKQGKKRRTTFDLPLAYYPQVSNRPMESFLRDSTMLPTNKQEKQLFGLTQHQRRKRKG